jgi:hypothetical protein
MDCPYVGGYVDIFAARFAEPSACEPRTFSGDTLVDPTPELPGRPVFPGQARVPRPEDFIRPQPEQPRQ